MFPIDETLAAELAKTSYVGCARITVLWPDGSVRRVFDLGERIVLTGSVTDERRRDVRRSASLTIANDEDGTLAPALADDLFAQGSPLLIELGAEIDGSPVVAPVVTGFVTLGQVSFPGGTISLSVESYMSALRQQHGTGQQLVAGAFLIDVLHALWDVVLPNVTWVVEAGADERALGADIPVLATDSRLDIGLKIARDLGVEVFDDRIGRIVVRVRPDPTVQPTTRVMTEPIDLQRTLGRPQVNGQVVVASPGNAEPIYSVAEVDDPASPLFKDKIGLRLAPLIQSDSIPDPATGMATARTWLAARALSGDTLEVINLRSHIDLDSGDITERQHGPTKTSGRFVIEAITIPIGPGSLPTSESQVQPLFLEDDT